MQKVIKKPLLVNFNEDIKDGIKRVADSKGITMNAFINSEMDKAVKRVERGNK